MMVSGLCLNISDITIIAVKNVDYRCIIYKITKFEAIKLLENTVLEDIGFYKKILLVLIFTFLFSIYKMFDSLEKSLIIKIGTVKKDPEMIKFVRDHLKTNKIWKHAAKKLPKLLGFVPDQYKAQQMCDKTNL